MMEVPQLFLCGPRGADCKPSTLSAPPQTGRSPSAAFADGKLLLATTHAANGNGANLLRCDADGTGCALADISAGLGPDSGLFPQIAASADGALLVVARNGVTPFLYRCKRDGSGCSACDVSASMGGFDASDPRARPSLVAFDAGFLVVWPTAQSAMASRCALSGASCKGLDLGAKVPGAREPSAALDVANQKLLVTVRDASQRVHLLRCDLDLASCESREIGAGLLPSLAVAPALGKIAVVTSAGGAGALVTCRVDGSGCASIPLEPSAHDVGAASLAIDASSHLYAAWNEETGKKLVLFDLALF